jgi:hypothetical protein
MRQLLWVVVVSVLLTGCSAAEKDPEPAFAPTPEPWGSEYVTATFDPPFTARLVDGWTVVERDANHAQIFKACDTCPQKGVENGAITLDMSLAEDTPERAIAALTKAKGITADKPVDTQLGYMAGMQFNAARAGAVRFPGSGYTSEATGGPIIVFTTAAEGRTVTIFLDPHAAQGDALAEFNATALRIATNIRFEQ